MFINKLRLQNFKRFTDLTIDLSALQPAPKLVLLIGANGSGKSCVFDAFEWVAQANRGPVNGENGYYRKDQEQVAEATIEFAGQAVPAQRHGSALTQPFYTRTFYGRSALRQVPRLTSTRSVFQLNPDADEDRPRQYIDIDQRFENDIEMLTGEIAAEIFDLERFDQERLKAKFVAPINQALQRIFGTDRATALTLHALILPLQGKTANIQFRKGKSEIHYDLLSSGEKEIVNILFNLLNRSTAYTDTIYFIDELDVHLNTALQYNLLKEITEHWLPANCQLWTASHSLGFIKYAKEAPHAALLDFDQFDFDFAQTLTPLPKDATEIFDIAVPADVLPTLFKDKQFIFCENQDDLRYQSLGFPDKVFYGVRDKNEVYYRLKKNQEFYGLIDRDYLADTEVAAIRRQLPRLYVLAYYAIENYLYHPDNVKALDPAFDVTTYKAEITRQKKEQFNRILLGLKQARSYKILADEKLEAPEALEIVAAALESDDFETFYPYFNMKDKFSAKPNYRPTLLGRTAWFKTALAKVFES